MSYNGLFEFLASNLSQLVERVYFDVHVGSFGACLFADRLDHDDVFEHRFRAHELNGLGRIVAHDHSQVCYFKI